MPPRARLPGPGWSVPIAVVFGIPLRIHVTFLALPALVAWAAHVQRQPIVPMLGFLALVFLCTALHEFGHALVALRLGIRADRVTLYPTGGIVWFDELPQPRDEWRIAIAGPVVNLGIAAAIAAGLAATVGPSALAPSVTGQSTATGFIAALLWINLSLAAFNLVPAYPMDGGRILRAVLTFWSTPARATAIAAGVGMALAIGLAMAGWSLGNAWFGVLALVVFAGALKQPQAEKPDTVALWAAEAMATDFGVLDPDETLATAAARASTSAQQEYPVVDRDGRIAGVLTLSLLYGGLEFRGPGTRVGDAASPDAPRIDVKDDLRTVLTGAHARSGLPVLVLDGERIVGMIPSARVREYADIETARRGAGRNRRVPA